MVKYYLPNELPVRELDYSYLIRLVGDANAELARYDGSELAVKVEKTYKTSRRERPGISPIYLVKILFLQ